MLRRMIKSSVFIAEKDEEMKAAAVFKMGFMNLRVWVYLRYTDLVVLGYLYSDLEI